MEKNFLAVLVCCALLGTAAIGYGEDKATELAKKLQNPVSDLISVPFQNNFNFGYGPENNMQYVLNIQPVIPQHLSEQWNWIHRTIFPVINQPSPVNTFGLGDIQYQGFLSPAKPGKTDLGRGPRSPSALGHRRATGDREMERRPRGGGPAHGRTLGQRRPAEQHLVFRRRRFPVLCQPDAVPALSQLQPGTGTGDRFVSDHYRELGGAERPAVDRAAGGPDLPDHPHRQGPGQFPARRVL